MKRLFALRDADGYLVLGIPKANGPLFFESKVEAKARRDEINEVNIGTTVHVTAGPDNHNWKGA